MEEGKIGTQDAFDNLLNTMDEVGGKMA